VSSLIDGTREANIHSTLAQIDWGNHRLGDRMLCGRGWSLVGNRFPKRCRFFINSQPRSMSAKAAESPPNILRHQLRCSGRSEGS
jgi:hypothetical protein